ncbi:fused response regulator/phosphatase [Bradyrhizobium sp. Y36]|uniref:PP2C family protein-serine/threonine phosphatase n=1 Tax=Bradyrhizobium sp. Y36 TaxID=2035447 RepID=UPI000BE80F1F|nr:SpoIIE family protein phosphatase [Bradyrhizobium sp. Y36]PDT88753.1 fused response regulator/phosphatase [Bradyrhizobium sp. Y36]
MSPANPNAPAEGAASGRSSRDARILIADDEPLTRKLLAAILQAQHFSNLRFAENGQETLDLMQSFQPDLLLLDMQMPDIGGLDVCRAVRLRDEFIDIPILVQTATVNRREMGDLFRAGASDYLSKPINPAELVARVVVHLERHNMLRELRNYRERISSELEAARQMQADLLPTLAGQRAVAETAGLRIASYSRSSSEIGGDLWGLLPLDDGRFGVFLADFTGHGVTAALNTFRLHALVHEYRSLHGDPAGLLSMLNDRLVRLLPPGQFATFLYVIVDSKAGEVRFATAGAPPPIMTSESKDSARSFEASGVPLGIARGMIYEEHIHPFAEDMRLLLFSDGLPEFTNGKDDRIGEAGLVTKLESIPQAIAPRELIDSICLAAGINDGVAMPDDTTIICIDRRAHCSIPCIIKTGLNSGFDVACRVPAQEEVRCRSA